MAYLLSPHIHVSTGRQLSSNSDGNTQRSEAEYAFPQPRDWLAAVSLGYLPLLYIYAYIPNETATISEAHRLLSLTAHMQVNATGSTHFFRR